VAVLTGTPQPTSAATDRPLRGKLRGNAANVLAEGISSTRHHCHFGMRYVHSSGIVRKRLHSYWSGHV
jgi:hypothetical protein